MKEIEIIQSLDGSTFNKEPSCRLTHSETIEQETDDGAHDGAISRGGSTLNAEPIHRLPKGSSLSFGDEVNEGNVEPQVSSGVSPSPSATAALSQSQGLASPSAPPSPDEGSASHRQEESMANDEAEEEYNGVREEFEPRPGSESAVEHIRLQLWDRRPVRGTPFRAKAEVRVHSQRITSFINFTESRKWYGRRQDTAPANQYWYECYGGTVAPVEKAYEGEKDYRPRIGHMIKRPEYGKRT